MRISVVAVAVAVATLAVATYAAYTAVEVADDAGAVSFGTTLDTSLYRTSAGVLKTDGSVQVVQNMNAGTITAGTTITSGTTITAGTSLTAGSINTAGTITSTNTGTSVAASGQITARNLQLSPAGTVPANQFTELGLNLLLPSNGYASVNTNGHYFRMKQAGMRLVQTVAQSFGEQNTMVTMDSSVGSEGWNVVSGMWTPGDSFFRVPVLAGWYHCAANLNLGGSSTTLLPTEPNGAFLTRVLTIGVNYNDALGWRSIASSATGMAGITSLSVSQVVYLGVDYKVSLWYSTNAQNSAGQTCNSRIPLSWGTSNVLGGQVMASLSCTYIGES